VLAIEAECRAQAEPEAPVESGADRLALRREFRLEDVWFAYDGAAVDYVLRGVDLEIEAGTMTALVGPSGAGKSTIADLMNGLLTPARGRVVLDGQVLGSAAIQQWRRHVGYVGQETVLFHMTVRENLLWARPEASDAELRRAMELVSADFVYALPLGLETVVGDRGILLSSGQRQRIAVARALLRRPALLILDEATNALDVDNEARLLDGIRAAMAEAGSGMTVLMIAHRASAIQRADRVFELQGGCVVRSGTAEEFSRA
jgi:ATP-binding cassette subfamily C protein